MSLEDNLASASESFIDTPENRKNYGEGEELTDEQIDAIPIDGLREHKPVRPSKLLSGEIPASENKTDAERGKAKWK